MTTTPLTPDTADIMDEVHRALTFENYGLIEKVGQLTGYPYQTIHSRITNRVKEFDSKSLDIIRAAHYLTRSPRLERFLLWPGLRAVDEVPVTPEKDVEGDFGDCLLELSKALEQFREALSSSSPGGSGITPDEGRNVEGRLTRLEKEIGDVRAHLKQALERGQSRGLKIVQG